MGMYLEKLRNTVTEIQARQLTNLLVAQKNSGEIRNLEEFRSRLNELTSKLLSENITPSLELFFGQFNNIIDSETFDFMLERIRDDLETAFSESNVLSEVLLSHKNIINNVLLKAISFGIAELESKISLYEFLARDSSGFDNAQFNTFKASQNLRTSRSNKDSNVLFKDPRAKDLIADDVIIDAIGESIVLGNNILSFVLPKSVRQVFDVEATQSLDNVAFSTSDISNIIDGSPGTFWNYSVLQKEPNKKISIKVELDLGNYADINFITIEAASIYPMSLERIEYINANNQSINLSIVEEISNTPKSIYFDRITTNKIFLIFSQSNGLEVQYSQKNIAVNYDKIVSGQTSAIDIDSIATKISDVINSSKILQDVFFLNDAPEQMKKFYDYSFGFDNIKLGVGTFKQRSIFVSSPINLDELSQLAIKTKEKRPIESSDVISMTSDTYPTQDSGQYFHGSIEYWGIIYNYQSNNHLIDIAIVPILPVGASRIYHERLILSNKISSSVGNAGRLMFYTKHFTEDDLNDIKVYRNGTLLTRNIDWIIDEFLTNDIPSPSGNPNTVGIKIIHPSNTDFFTVSYTPLRSNTRALPLSVSSVSLENEESFIKIVDELGDGSIRFGSDNILYISAIKNGGKITAKSLIYLAIILRRNSPNEHLSPTVEEYMLLTSSNNSEKFNVK